MIYDNLNTEQLDNAHYLALSAAPPSVPTPLSDPGGCIWSPEAAGPGPRMPLLRSGLSETQCLKPEMRT